MTEDKGQEIFLEGVAASPGVAHGPAFVFLQKKLEIPFFTVDAAHIQDEIQRFESALLGAREDLQKLRDEVEKQLGEDEAQIFDAQMMVLEDNALINETISELETSRYNIEYCFREVAGRFIDAFTAIDDPYIKERVKDIQDVERRVLEKLLGETEHAFSTLGDHHVIVSEDITPSDAAAFEKSKVLAIVTDVGSKTSHAVIIAHSLGIPAVVGLHDVSERVESAQTLLVDGYEGRVYINPSNETLFRYGQLREERRSIEKIFLHEAQQPSETTDKRRVQLSANVGMPEDCYLALKNGGEGIGLFRTESFYIRTGKFPTEAEQFQNYDRIADIMAPHPVTMRTLDMGGDKQFSSVGFKLDERNPFMGFRAIRFCLEHGDVFREQLRAILRASHRGNVRVMFPMISSVDQFLEAKSHVEACFAELIERGDAYDAKLAIGSMIEIPSAAIVADQLAEHCDFFSIGTNDLIQYLLAVDRINDRIAHLYQPGHPAVLRTVQSIIAAAVSHDIGVSVCGEMASDPLFVPFLVGAGATELSVAPSSLPEIKYLIRKMDYAQAQQLARHIVGLNDSREVEACLHDYFHKTLVDLLPKGYYRTY